MIRDNCPSKFTVNIREAAIHEGGYLTYFHDVFMEVYRETGRIVYTCDFRNTKFGDDYVIFAADDYNSKLHEEFDECNIDDIYIKWNESATLIFNLFPKVTNCSNTSRPALCTFY